MSKRYCDKCGAEMDWVDIRYSPYPRGHWKCPKCGFEVSKK